MSKGLNIVQLIGNLTRDPELRYTPTGKPVCIFNLATNRSWTADSGEKKEETEYHRIIAWNGLAETCSKYLTKGTKLYVQGRLATRSWTAQDGTEKTTTEVVIDEMIILSPKKTDDTAEATATSGQRPAPADTTNKNQTVNPDEVPF